MLLYGATELIENVAAEISRKIHNLLGVVTNILY
jgi:hypothetical protein